LAAAKLELEEVGVMSELADYFLKLEKDAWSGEVQVTASEGNAFIVLEFGRLAYAYRPLDRAAERLSRIKEFKLPPENVTTSARSWEEFLKYLFSINLQSMEPLTHFLKTDRLELFFRIFFWTNVELRATPLSMDIASSPTLSFYSKRDLSKLIQEAETRLQEWPLIQKKIGSSRRIFVSRVARSETRQGKGLNRDAIDSAITQFEGAGLVSGPQPFTEDQMDLLNLCNGSNSVQEIVRLSIDGEFLTLRRLIDLWDRGLIAPKEEEGLLQVGDIPLLSGWHDWKASILVISIFAITIFGFKAGVLPERSAQVTRPLLTAIELYRAEKGRYPVSLEELTRAGLIQGLDPLRYDYQLINLSEYQIRPKTKE
jgi:hypothetical protein